MLIEELGSSLPVLTGGRRSTSLVGFLVSPLDIPCSKDSTLRKTSSAAVAWSRVVVLPAHERENGANCRLREGRFIQTLCWKFDSATGHRRSLGSRQSTGASSIPEIAVPLGSSGCLIGALALWSLWLSLGWVGATLVGGGIGKLYN